MNDNEHPTIGVISTTMPDGGQLHAVVEYDKLGPILRAGPYDTADEAIERARDLVSLRDVEARLARKRKGGKA